ncbi:MAG TPA: hypothetical protein VFE17_08190 [Candidatus Baltobacteraceae bacterium]|jgi:hypothetical protein|nr:hypothetical protein [Candidatus Baltobacteraceae bacterium]
MPERDYKHRSLVDKLGVKPGLRIAAINISSLPFIDLLAHAVGSKPSFSLRGKYDMVFLQIDTIKDLSRIPNVVEHLTDAGALWVFHPKGKDAAVKDAEVREVYLSCGLVDNKISAYTETHTATRCVIPLARRSGGRRQ